ncbi:hypothetical protein [Pseudanabaena yagii]|uniref:Uncharacterized protein n=1 Tax=Pseudanabaena yagii GIHE-NHR1 TaxID=2722753 RepID=A0ABX1LVF1_9CYAN|nr:hypothetical protein [Pseudanabaena yagii]NMF60143.1 hypothetical protein [Pseudanabaena yagii GIHE-NHR1]
MSIGAIISKIHHKNCIANAQTFMPSTNELLLRLGSYRWMVKVKGKAFNDSKLSVISEVVALMLCPYEFLQIVMVISGEF